MFWLRKLQELHLQVTEMVWEDEVPAAEEAQAAGQPSTAAAVPGRDDAAPMETKAEAAGGQELAKTRSGSPAKAASSAKGSGLSGPAAAQKVLRIDPHGAAVASQAAHAMPGFRCTGSPTLSWQDLSRR